jgi:hypothetical protein
VLKKKRLTQKLKKIYENRNIALAVLVPFPALTIVLVLITKVFVDYCMLAGLWNREFLAYLSAAITIIFWAAWVTVFCYALALFLKIRNSSNKLKFTPIPPIQNFSTEMSDSTDLLYCRIAEMDIRPASTGFGSN